MRVDAKIKAESLGPRLERLFTLTGAKIHALNRAWEPAKGSPVFTVAGKYVARGWTEWTQGFQFGCQILQFDATGDKEFLALGRENTLCFMAPHLTSVGVHDHGFNNLSTYGNLRRLAIEGRIDDARALLPFCDLALRVSGAVQAARWTTLADGTGFIHSFNGPHSLFCDTIRSCRSLALAHALGQRLMGENDRRISLLDRMLEHIRNTAKYNVYYGESRDSYDVRGRVAHESLFNVTDGNYRCPSTQQGYSPFTTWTRGLAWIMLGAAEQIEFIETLPDKALHGAANKTEALEILMKMGRAAGDYYLENTAADGIPFWDTGAPGLAALRDWRKKPSKPDNAHEPVDSSAAAIAAQGLLRLGHYLGISKNPGKQYWQAGLGVARTLLNAPYLSENPKHQGILLHSIYHRPNGWDYIPRGKKVPQGESSMWGDYHLMELGVYLKRIIDGDHYPTFFA